MISPLLLTSVACLILSADPPPAEFSMGDAAPKFETKEFVKGESVEELEKGKTYVVEFWATWCAPCRESIPHLTELQKKYKDVTVIGVSIDEDADQVKPFVDKMGDKMDYRVAIDAREGKKCKMSQTWLDASGQDGIPTAYVVNEDGKVAWIGHPGEIEEPLKQIVAGKWDLAAKAAEFKKALAEQKFGREAEQRLVKLLKEKDYAEALKLCDEIVAKHNQFAAETAMLRLALMVHFHKDPAQIVAIAQVQSKDEGKGYESMLTVLKAIISPTDFLNPDSEVKNKAPEKLDPVIAKFVVAQADKIDDMIKKELGAATGKEPADKPSEAKPGDEETPDANAEGGFTIADSKLLLARAYQAAGEKEKAIAKLDDGIKALNATIRAAREDINDFKEMKKSLTGDAKDEKSADEKPSDDSSEKPVVRRKKKVDP